MRDMKVALGAVIVTATALGVVSAYGQEPMYWSAASAEDTYKFKRPIRRVAIIGAGVGGLVAYQELTQSGTFDVVDIYERDYIPGGNWHYTDEMPVDAPVPNAPIAVGDYEPSLPPQGVTFPYVEEYDQSVDGEELRRRHRAPKPIWKSLVSIAPAPIQQIREMPWPKGTEWELPHAKIGRYIRAFASWHGVNTNDGNPHAFYNTRVEQVKKRYNEDGSDGGWTLIAKELIKTGHNTTRATWYRRNYDAVVAATGRYNAPNVPGIRGLEEWNREFPGRLVHSRQYRTPYSYKGQTVLVIGAATSGGEIARELLQHAEKVYVSIRPDRFQGPHFSLADRLKQLPVNITLIGEIKSFNAPASSIRSSSVELVNGTVITGLDSVIFGTGYRYTYPFLPDYINPSLGVNDTLPRTEGVTQPIITDGTHIRSLYLDSFYIPDPTLVFINMNAGIQSFTYSEFVSLAAAKVWSGKADLPNTKTLWEKYDKTVKERQGYGWYLQFLGAERTDANLRFFVSWLNQAAEKYGGRQIDQLPKDIAEIAKVWACAWLSNLNRGSTHPNNLLPLGVVNAPFGQLQSSEPAVDGSEPWVQDAVFSDWW